MMAGKVSITGLYISAILLSISLHMESAKMPEITDVVHQNVVVIRANGPNYGRRYVCLRQQRLNDGGELIIFQEESVMTEA